MSCGNCGQTNGETLVEAWIQPCSGETPLFSNIVDGDLPAIKFTNLAPARKGKKTKKRKKDSRNGNWIICTTTTDAPGDATVDLEIAACGCGGYAPRDLEDKAFHTYMKYFCCGTLTYVKVITDIELPDPKFDTLNDYDAAFDGKVSYSGALIGDEYDIYPLGFTEVAASAGLDTDLIIRSVAWFESDAGCGKRCGRGCADRWAAVTDDGGVLYKPSGSQGVKRVAIGGYVGGTGNSRIAYNDGKLYVSYKNSAGPDYGYYYAILDGNGDPGSWTKVTVDTEDNAVAAAINTTAGITFVTTTTGGATVLVNVVEGGQFSTVQAYAAPFISIDVCGNQQVAGTFGGSVAVKGCNNAWSAVAVAPAVVPITAIAIQPGTGDYWVGTNAGVVWVSKDGGYSWSEVGLPASTTYIASIKWANSLTGYIASQNPAKVFATFDGGATWEDATDRIAGPIANATALWDMAVPCCDNPTLAANNVLVAGVTLATTGGVWWGQKTTC